jgi:hypothetical protein
MKREFRLVKAFGKNEHDFADLPPKISGIAVSRILIGDESGCSVCFPHGCETVNSHINNRQRSWKKFRGKQWKSGFYLS